VIISKDTLLRSVLYLKKIAKNVLAFFYARKQPRMQKVLRRGAGILTLFLLLFVAIDCNFLWLFGESPSVRDIMHPKPAIASEVYSADSVLLGKYFYENRVAVLYSQISPMLIRTLVATEDERFYKHMGIDIIGSVSAITGALHGNARGASTITQQLVKNLYKTRSREKRGLLGGVPLIRIGIIKVKEMINAFKLEVLFDKKDIVTLYLNTVDFGNNAFGIKTAAKTYFNTTPMELKPEQCAQLVGMLKATTTYNPVRNLKKATERRNIVLGIMMTHGIITINEHAHLIKKKISLRLTPEKVNDGTASYFRQALIDYLRPWLRKHNYDLYADGLRIYTTVDASMQNYAEAAVAKNMKRLQGIFDDHWSGRNPWVDENYKEMPDFVNMIMRQSWEYRKLENQYAAFPDSLEWYVNKKTKRRLFSWRGDFDSTLSLRELFDYNLRFLRAGFIALEPQTGMVRAWVGDIDFENFKYDHVNQSKRQPGSTFKTFVYTAAIDNGYAPCDSITDKPVTIKYVENGKPKSWSPHNADWTFLDSKVTLKYAFARSLNSITVQVADKIGWRKVIAVANKMGIESTIDTVPSICLGVSDVTLLELVRAYCPIANGGNRIEPQLITRVLDRKGKLLATFKPTSEKILNDETAFLMQRMFLGTMTEPRGTTQALYAYDLFRYNTDIGGKTGTSSNHSDGWFVGVTPKLVAGAWVGGEERCIHFRTSALGEGCKTALPIVGSFFEKVLADTSLRKVRGHFNNNGEMTNKEYKCVTPFVDKVDSLSGDTELQDGEKSSD
jgi:penicillin-binding protein 1A